MLRFVAFTVAFLVNAKMETYAGNLIGNHTRLSVTDVGKTFSPACARRCRQRRLSLVWAASYSQFQVEQFVPPDFLPNLDAAAPKVPCGVYPRLNLAISKKPQRLPGLRCQLLSPSHGV